jgi:hypothetical protein
MLDKADPVRAEIEAYIVRLRRRRKTIERLIAALETYEQIRSAQPVPVPALRSGAITSVRNR